MNHRIILRILSRVCLAEAALLLLTAIIALCYGDAVLLPYGVPIALLLALFFLFGLSKPRSPVFFAREGFVSVALSWILMSLLGALPFCLSGAIPSFVDSFFETVSGFTTTGATVLADVESMPKGLLFWRGFTHWVGGMGVLVFLMAIIPLAGDRSIHLMRAESPGPSVGKLAPRLRSTAVILYSIYIAMTLLLVVLLFAGGMPLFDSFTHAFATAGTGGFSVRNAGIIAYNSPYIEGVLTVFMLLFAVNFSLYHLLLLRRFRDVLRSEELKWFLGVFVLASAAMTLDILPQSKGVGEAIRLATFQSASIMSTTGFATADFSLWPGFSQTIVLLLMIIGSCAGSTGGGFKISRLVILLKSIRRELDRMLHPRSMGRISFEGKSVGTEVTHGVLVYLAVYVVLVIFGALVLSVNEFDVQTTLSSVLTSLNNVGPGLGLVGPMENFALYAPFSKLWLSLYMLIGRLEIFPILMLFSPTVWRKR
ncbi:MAG: TrkH family potassium uptake protein [Oscillospiraceae bacterium]|jgi:trk system potassium uptake protein TrkH|nr:TrkH family potassium uptake protein [Oscillospiraceae bacterium]